MKGLPFFRTHANCKSAFNLNPSIQFICSFPPTAPIYLLATVTQIPPLQPAQLFSIHKNALVHRRKIKLRRALFICAFLKVVKSHRVRWQIHSAKRARIRLFNNPLFLPRTRSSVSRMWVLNAKRGRMNTSERAWKGGFNNCIVSLSGRRSLFWMNDGKDALMNLLNVRSDTAY